MRRHLTVEYKPHAKVLDMIDRESTSSQRWDFLVTRPLYPWKPQRLPPTVFTRQGRISRVDCLRVWLVLALQAYVEGASSSSRNFSDPATGDLTMSSSLKYAIS